MVKKLIGAFCVAMFASVFSVVNADLADLKSRVEALEAKTGGALGGVELYGSFRPSLRFIYHDDNLEDETDVKDNLSRLGVKGSVDLHHGWSAFYRGEWKVNIGDDDGDGTDLGDARLAYVGLGTPLGEIAIGQQWNTYYNIVAEVTDIYQHARSPFGWDFNGPFRTPSMVTYKAHFGNLGIQAGGRFNGGDGGSHRHANEYNIGAGYRFDMMNAYLGVAFRNTQGVRRTLTAEGADMAATGDHADTDWYAFGGSINPTDRLYLAFTYQDGEQDDAVATLIADGDGDGTADDPITGLDDADKQSLDIVASYDLGNGWSTIVGYFDSEDDSDSARAIRAMDNDNGRAGDVLGSRGDFDGFNVTLQKHLNSNMRVWVEWLSSEADDSAVDKDDVEYYADDALSIGFRYDFSTK